MGAAVLPRRPSHHMHSKRRVREVRGNGARTRTRLFCFHHQDQQPTLTSHLAHANILLHVLESPISNRLTARAEAGRLADRFATTSGSRDGR